MGGSSSDDSHSGSIYSYRDEESVTRKSAKKYAEEDNRVYSATSSKGIPPPIGKEISTDSTLATILVVDVTGSMRTWPKLIFDKVPVLYEESNAAMQGLDLEKLKKGGVTESKLEMAVIAIGDAYCDSYPLQVVDFAKGVDLVKGIDKIFPEGEGGPFGRESYELAAYFIANHCKTPNVPKNAKPVLIYACDEDFYQAIKPDHVKTYVGDSVGQSIQSDSVIKDLAKRFDMYVLRPEPEGPTEVYARAQKHWESLIGSQRVLKVESMNRLVDDVVMICGIASDNYQNAIALLERRQIDKKNPAEGLEKVTQVLETLHPILGDKTVKSELARLGKKYGSGGDASYKKGASKR